METGDKTAVEATFYRCCDPACGLRFPVTPLDPFAGNCPRCRGPVLLMAQRAAGPPVTPLTPRQGPPFHLVLDNWRSCFNVGSAFRSADGLGACTLHLCGITPTPDAQLKIGKTALGAEANVPWRYHADAVAAVTALKNTGAGVWVLEATGDALPLNHGPDLESARPVVLVAGNEVAGVDPGILELADGVVALPMRGIKRSLNVAIALSIAAYWMALAPGTAAK